MRGETGLTEMAEWYLSAFLTWTRKKSRFQWYSQHVLTTISSGSRVTSVQLANSTGGGGNGNGSGLPAATFLDAGPSLTLSPPAGAAINAPALQTGFY